MSRSEIESEMRKIWAKVLKLSDQKSSGIRDDSCFFDYGGTSIRIGFMNIMLTRRFGKTVSPEIFYEGATFGRMVECMMEAE